jgi:hypothetical protein
LVWAFCSATFIAAVVSLLPWQRALQLKQIAPSVTRAAVFRSPAIPSGIGQFGAIQAVAPSLGVEVNLVNVRDASEIESTVAAFALRMAA